MSTAAGLLGSADFSGGAGSAVLYTCPANRKNAVTLTIVNSTGAAAVKARGGWATGTATAPVGGQWKLGGVAGKAIPPGETVEITMMVGPGQKVVAGCDAAGISASCSGIEEAL